MRKMLLIPLYNDAPGENMKLSEIFKLCAQLNFDAAIFSSYIQYIILSSQPSSPLLKQSSVLKNMNFTESKITDVVKLLVNHGRRLLNLIRASVCILFLFPGCFELPVSFFFGK